MKLLKPYYYDEFKCIGDKCISHCCKDWKITIDKETYNYYQSVPEPFGDQLRQNISTDENVHYFKLNEDKTCPFLNEKRLCNIFIELGEKRMCSTCKTYPRSSKVRADVIEQTLTLSCPEVARMLIESSEPIDFCFVDDVTSSIHEQPVDDLLFNFLLKARACSIDIMQMRNFTLWERQLLLVIFSNKIQVCIDNKQYSDIDTLVNKFSDPKFLSLYVVELERLKSLDDSSYIFTNNFITKTMLPFLKRNLYMKKIFERQILNIDQMTLYDFLVKYSAEFNKYMNDKSHMYENYYVHTLFRYYMDALNDKSVIKQVIFTNIGYLIIHIFQMISWVDSGKILTSENSQLIFSGFSSSFEHNNTTYEQIFNMFKEQDLTSLAFQAFMLS